MDKRVVVAAAVSVLILLSWSYLFPPPRPPVEPEPAPVPVESAAAPEQPALREGTPPPAEDELRPATAEQPTIQAAEAREIRVETDTFQVTLTNRGGYALSWMLRDYTTADAEPLELLPQFVDVHPQMLGIDIDDAGMAAIFSDALYEVEREPVPAEGGLSRGERVRFSWADGRGLEVRKTLTFRDTSYLVDLELDVTDRGRRLPARLLLGPGFGAQEGQSGRSTYYYASQTVWNRAGSVTRLKQKKTTNEPGRFSSSLKWIGLEDQYFAALILPGEEPTDVVWRPVEVTPRAAAGDEQIAEPVGEPLLSVAVPSSRATLYVGPKKYTLLRSLGHELGKVVWFASNGFLAWIARFIFLCLIWIHDHTIANYGLAIVLSTFLLRLILFPVNQYSMVSMKKTQMQMQRLQPKIKAIRAKNKKTKDADSRAKMNQEMMDLYKREGVNPMGGLNGCLPLLAQFPILIGFYNMLTVAVELRGAPFFGWIQDLSQSDPYWITPLLMGGTMFLQQKMAMSKVKDPMQQQQQRFMMFMPVVFTWICLQMPAGMVLYWFVNNVLGMGQQWLVNRHTSRLETAAQKA